MSLAARELDPGAREWRLCPVLLEVLLQRPLRDLLAVRGSRDRHTWEIVSQEVPEPSRSVWREVRAGEQAAVRLADPTTARAFEALVPR